jgi:hypothetical protein
MTDRTEQQLAGARNGIAREQQLAGARNGIAREAQKGMPTGGTA